MAFEMLANGDVTVLADFATNGRSSREIRIINFTNQWFVAEITEGKESRFRLVASPLGTTSATLPAAARSVINKRETADGLPDLPEGWGYRWSFSRTAP